MDSEDGLKEKKQKIVIIRTPSEKKISSSSSLFLSSVSSSVSSSASNSSQLSSSSSACSTCSACSTSSSSTSSVSSSPQSSFDNSNLIPHLLQLEKELNSNDGNPKKIPPLDFRKLKKNKKRPTSEILPNEFFRKTVKIEAERHIKTDGSIDELLKTNRETSQVIEEIRQSLDIIKKSVNSDEKIRKELKEIRNRIHRLIPVSESPKTISRCDAIVGNTQMIISNIHKLSKKEDERYVSIISMISSLSIDVSRIQNDIDKLNSLLTSDQI